MMRLRGVAGGDPKLVTHECFYVARIMAPFIELRCV